MVVVAVVVVVELQQAPEDDHQKRHSGTWKWDDFTTVG